ncbi:4Fe-4S cluster-binding domain-containing protein [Virgibacillus salexigens]|uniref:Anaerobic ribonucleotide reductase-activating protein n=1 Tax=Virgibacillus massiliensis TaxID=1462526 RepID=A0A024QHE0_9BACI|nr:DUF2116 family Zn-ribbon domain-containing protein [Virgibacillus massiliensis]CDQ41909.1 anaerobic ribonucleotide reductase-activating protein [Virgibacillus massiliensis]
MNDILRFIGVTKDALTAGPGKRLELFTKGCIRGVVSPCEGCFNSITWSFEGKYKTYRIQELVDMISKDAWNRQVTFCGGEPILQARTLTEVAKQLKKIDPTFHFVMYTMYKLDVLMKYGLNFTWVKEKHEQAMLKQLMDYSSSYDIQAFDEDHNPTRVKYTILTPEDVKELMRYIDIIVDGEYKHELRLTTAEYMHDGGFIGSSNQRVIYGPNTMRQYDIYKNLGENYDLIFHYSDEYMKIYESNHHCKSCGKSIKAEDSYCTQLCEARYTQRKENMKLISNEGV